MDYFYYLCSMMTKNLYTNIVDSMRNALITNMLYPPLFCDRYKKLTLSFRRFCSSNRQIPLLLLAPSFSGRALFLCRTLTNQIP